MDCCGNNLSRLGTAEKVHFWRARLPRPSRAGQLFFMQKTYSFHNLFWNEVINIDPI
jgi:hypothetical protein